MKSFLAEFWVWILIPTLIVMAAVAALYYLGGDESASPFAYEVIR